MQRNLIRKNIKNWFGLFTHIQVFFGSLGTFQIKTASPINYSLGIMMKIQHFLATSVFVLSQSFVAFPAFAEESSEISTVNEVVEASPSPVQVQVQVPESEPATISRKIPKLSIRWDCGDCPINEKVIPLIEKTYTAEASQHNYALSEEETAEVSIIDFRQRNPANRALFGFMAGKDRLGVKVNYKGKLFTASDYSANAWFGMNSLCESVAKSTYKQIAASINQ